MNKRNQLIIVLAAVFCIPVQAAEKASAFTRAYLYQREAKAVLESRGWHVSRDANGKLVADHPLGFTGTGVGPQKYELVAKPMASNSPFRSFAWLTLTFKPDTNARTKCAANIVAYMFSEGMYASDKNHPKPFPFNNPETSKEIQDIMAKAESNLTAKHPEYTGR